ncbi:unnamed protein product [Parnassius mnemosyne]|uniref:BESS domain-containing protein n=1 Tax=Parnassius mnemosyne TaxID=213953 RepID=A0AAV1KZT4_9NEOP
MGEIDVKKLIKSIKKRPALYDKNDNMYYGHRGFKDKLWREVGEEVHANWGEWKPYEQNEYVRELQKRWKSLRTCFTRELCFQKQEKLEKVKQDPDGLPMRKRKKYEYFDMMSFLINPDAEVESDDNDSSDPLEGDHKNVEIVYSFSDTSKTRDSKETNIVENNEPSNLQRSYVYERNETAEESILHILRDMKKHESDEDRQFMLSLVPCFKKLSDEQKFEAKIEMLKVLKNITFQDKPSTS